MTETRLIDIETKLAYLEDTVLKLNDIVCEQQQQIQTLERKNQLLIERFQELNASNQDSAQEQKPPHY